MECTQNTPGWDCSWAKVDSCWNAAVNNNQCCCDDNTLNRSCADFDDSLCSEDPPTKIVNLSDVQDASLSDRDYCYLKICGCNYGCCYYSNNGSCDGTGGSNSVENHCASCDYTNECEDDGDQVSCGTAFAPPTGDSPTPSVRGSPKGSALDPSYSPVYRPPSGIPSETPWPPAVSVPWYSSVPNIAKKSLPYWAWIIIIGGSVAVVIILGIILGVRANKRANKRALAANKATDKVAPPRSPHIGK